MAITTYSTLVSAVNDWTDRSYSADKLLELVGLAENEFNMILRSHRRETSDTLTTDSNGEATLPSDYLKMRSITRDYSGATPLGPVGWRELIALNPTSEAGFPAFYAIRGTTLKVAPIAEDDFTIVYEQKLPALSKGNETNWLMTFSPNAYFYMTLSMAAGYDKDYGEAERFRALALQKMNEIGIQSDLAQYANAGIQLETVIP